MWDMFYIFDVAPQLIKYGILLQAYYVGTGIHGIRLTCYRPA